VFDERAACPWCERARKDADIEGAKYGTDAMPILSERLPHLLDEDGILVSLTGRPGVFGHSSDDAWWPCPRFAGVVWQPSLTTVATATPRRSKER
jgi:hypothetical protein